MKLFISIILCIASIPTLSWGQNAREVFVNMPDSILPILTKINRADCIDFLDSHMKALVKNRFDQQSEMTQLANDYIALNLSPKHHYELKLLPIDDSTKIICTIQTVCGKICDSRLDFYDTDWQPLKRESYITLPNQNDFIPDTIPTIIGDTLSTPWETLRHEADLLTMQASMTDSTHILTFTYTTPQYMIKEHAEIFIPLLKTCHISYLWNNGKFIRKPNE